jgi:hypothetical protein
MKQACHVRLVIWLNGMFVSIFKDKPLEQGILIALLATPMTTAISNIVNLVTQSSVQPAGTPQDPVTTTVAQPADEPIPVTTEPKE